MNGSLENGFTLSVSPALILKMRMNLKKLTTSSYEQSVSFPPHRIQRRSIYQCHDWRTIGDCANIYPIRPNVHYAHGTLIVVDSLKALDPEWPISEVDIKPVLGPRG